jgi:hypothetical protein
MEGFHPYLAQGPNAVDGSMEDKLNSNKFPYVYPGYDPIDQAPGADAYNREIPEYLQKRFKQCFTEAGKNIVGHQIIRPVPSEWILPYTEPEPSPPPDTADPPPSPDPPADPPADTASDPPPAQSPWQEWSSVDDSDSDSDEDQSDDVWDGWDG